MPRRFAQFGLLLLMMAAGLLGAQQVQKATSKVYRLRLRSVPDVSGKVVGHLAKGESVTLVEESTYTVTIDEKTDYWYRIVTSSGVKGWVFGGYINFDEKKP